MIIMEETTKYTLHDIRWVQSRQHMYVLEM